MTMGGYANDGVWQIDEGSDVMTSDGEKLGSVEEVYPHYLVVGKGLIFHTERYVPVSAITSVDDGSVYLSVVSNEVERQGWDMIPAMNDTAPTTNTTGAASYDADTSTRETSGTGDYVIPVAEEELDVHKRQVERGSVHVHKDVVEEVETVSVPVREESVRVERHAATGQQAADVGSHAFQEEDIEIPLRGEEVEVDTHAVVREHVHIDKDVHEREEQVSGTVRREEVYVEGEGTIEERERQ